VETQSVEVKMFFREDTFFDIGWGHAIRV